MVTLRPDETFDDAVPINNCETQTAVPKGPSQCWRSSAKYCILTFCCFNIVMIFIGGLYPALTGYSLHDHKEIIMIRTDKVIHEVSENFLSIALDTSLAARNWENFDFSNVAIQQMGSALAPCYLRLGGTAADRLLFSESGTVGEHSSTSLFPIDGADCAHEGEICAKHIDNFTMTGEDFIAINQYAKKSGMELLFDLNVLLRRGSEWDDTNAIEIIKFAEKNKFKIAWQLGNEPNAFRHVFHESIPPLQLGLDFLALRRLLNKSPLYKRSLLVGPDITRPRLPEQDDLKFLQEFLREAGLELDAVTWHQYYLNGREATLQDFLNEEILNQLYDQILMVKKAVRNMALDNPIWLSETGSAYGGGAPQLSDRFVAGFMWLDKLGVAATQGLDVVIRQSLYGGHYALIGSDLQPNPDFWLSVLHKSLVGRGVVGATQLANNNKGPVRVYAHCTAPGALLTGLGALTIFGLNLKDTHVELSLQGTHNVSRVHRYILQGETGLLSRDVLLNGVRLALLPDGSLPHLQPQLVDLSASITLPGHAIGFWVLHGAQVPACLHL